MKQILLITHSEDNPSVNAVSDAIRRKGGKPVRFNSDLYPGEIQISSSKDGAKWNNFFHAEDGNTYNLSEFESFWYRRIRIGDNLKNAIEPKYINPSIDEARKTFFGLLTSLDVFKLDNPSKTEWAGRKQLQLKVAAEVGLRIPETLITNDAASVKDFFKKCPSGIITKMQASFAIVEEGANNVVFTNLVDGDMLNDLDELKFCPMTFQENIQKQLELRTIVVGNKLFTASIDSQKSELAKDDWRKKGLSFINDWQKFDLPEDIENKLLKLMDYYGLNYGAIDLILTPDNKFYFLEINTVGEFFWLENNPGFPVSDSIADLLMGLAPRR